MSKEYFKGSDITCIGEAENYIANLLDTIEHKKSLNNFPGLIYKKNGHIINTGGSMKVENLDSSMSPAIELVKGKNYGNICNMKLKIAPIISSRGCPFACYFCTFKGFKHRVRSIDNVINEIKNIIKRGFYLNPKRIIRIIFKLLAKGELSLLFQFIKNNTFTSFFRFVNAYGKDPQLTDVS